MFEYFKSATKTVLIVMTLVNSLYPEPFQLILNSNRLLLWSKRQR